MKAKTQCWMVKRPGGTIAFHHASYLRRHAWDKLEKTFCDRYNRRKLRRMGWRVIRVSVREV